MSLINQMLKDLEQRGAGNSGVTIADTDKPMATKLGAVSKPQARQSKAGFPFIKIGGLVVLLAGGVYLWINNGSALFHKPEGTKADLANLKPQAKVSIANPATVQKVEAPVITVPAVEKPAIEKPAEIESPPLFALELKYKPIAAQSPSIKMDRNNVLPEPVTVKPVQIVEPVKLITPEKSTLKDHVTSDHVISKPIAKSNVNDTSIGKQIRPDQKSGNFYRQAIINLQQGRVAEAQANLTQALEANPANQEARLTLTGLLVDNKRNDEAKATLAAGLAISPEQSDFRMALARLQVEAGDRSAALNNLEQGLAYAKGNADYQSFLATLLQRAERHEEAINHYMTALSLNDTSPNSLIGLGISLQAVGKLENAQEAFTRAQASEALSPELSLFVEQRLKQINQRLHR
jgi:MSHA biogenesis protein MshN